MLRTLQYNYHCVVCGFTELQNPTFHMQINGKSTSKMTYAEAIELMNRYNTVNKECLLQVKYDKEGEADRPVYIIIGLIYHQL